MFRLTTLALLASVGLLSAQITVTRIVQSGDPAPGSAGNFPNSFANGFPAVRADGTVSFIGSQTSVPRVYTGTGIGNVSLVVNNGAAIPGGGTFLDFGTSTAIGAAGVVFWGANATTSPTIQGIYLSNGTTVNTIADLTMMAPGQTVNFTGFSSAQMPAISGNAIGFRGTFTGGSGIYVSNAGSLSRIADTTTAIPSGVGNFTTINANMSITGNLAVFRGNGSSSQQGVYLRDYSSAANPLIRVTDRSLNLPGTAALITTIFEPSVANSRIVFIASAGTDTQRVVQYTWNNSNSSPSFVETVLSKTGDPVPEQNGLLFTGYQGFTPVAGNLTAFIGRFNDGSNRTGIYVHDGASLHRIVDTTLSVDGKAISSMLLGMNGVAGNFVTYQLGFDNGTSGIYRAEITPIPEPACMGVITLAGLLCALRRKRCKVSGERRGVSSLWFS
jgi:hypothetical protein